MSQDTGLIVAGLALFIFGFAVAGGGRSDGVTVGNQAVTVFGSIKQTFHSTSLAISGERATTQRDWIGWTISGIGVVLGVVGLFK